MFESLNPIVLEPRRAEQTKRAREGPFDILRSRCDQYRNTEQAGGPSGSSLVHLHSSIDTDTKLSSGIFAGVRATSGCATLSASSVAGVRATSGCATLNASRASITSFSVASGRALLPESRGITFDMTSSCVVVWAATYLIDQILQTLPILFCSTRVIGFPCSEVAQRNGIIIIGRTESPSPPGSDLPPENRATANPAGYTLTQVYVL